MRHYIYILFIAFVLSLTSCRQDFDFEPSTGGLEFSKQTVYLDTVFSNIGSSTYTLKVYNNSDKDIKIPTLQLAQGENSKYRLMVDGIPGKVFRNVELLAKDSMFIFIETTIDYSEYANPDSEYLYTDKIEFHNISGAPQTVDLVTLVRDAYFLYPKRFSDGTYETLPIGDNDSIYGFYLDHNDPVNGNEYVWNESKPYVIYGYAAVPTGETLTISEGAKIHFHADSGLIIGNGATITATGDYSQYDSDGNVTDDNEIVFESDRLEPGFSDIAGQWGAIWMTEGSTGSFKNVTIKNATVGLLIEHNSSVINMRDVQIYNCSNVGVLARTGIIDGKNVVINNCGQAGLACSYGGDYNFTHCTFANYWPRPNQVPVAIDNGNDELQINLTNANFTNCIIYGSSSYGISLTQKGTAAFNYIFRNCLIKFVDFGQFEEDPLYPLANTANYPNCIIAENSTTNKPDFKNPDKNQFIIGDDSAAKETADPAFSTFNDILNNPRNALTTDMGAYNHIVFPN
ncbi:MAG TPA: right-handed parallel beta-helix repeat-containing protein [Flavobacterium sp.]|uniref:right-handed parallel beta-helix repeat-containing protein n=1 Tax=Flavobacterium sp. TaxID=239 RepID=UPI002BCA202C|nr:right-handed parallel beta-helix repeat-containing protein [Flavobacterium sp.]HSD13864.1 right-handed parallel beta-helix repeat-containing protein [Flavobacterium sp.]